MKSDELAALAIGVLAGAITAALAIAIGLWVVLPAAPTPQTTPAEVAAIDAITAAAPSAIDGIPALDEIRAFRPGSHEFRRDAATRDDLGGRSIVSPATTINWRSVSKLDSEGATVAGVLEAAALRLESIQQTPQAADGNARALWLVLRALKELR